MTAAKNAVIQDRNLGNLSSPDLQIEADLLMVKIPNRLIGFRQDLAGSFSARRVGSTGQLSIAIGGEV